jgi:hypothetical protein
MLDGLHLGSDSLLHQAMILEVVGVNEGPLQVRFPWFAVWAFATFHPLRMLSLSHLKADYRALDGQGSRQEPGSDSS